MSDGLLDWARAQRLYTERANRVRRAELLRQFLGAVGFLLLFLLAGWVDGWLA